MIELDFLEPEEIIGEKRSDIFKWFGANVKATDFVIMLGAYVPKIYRQNVQKLEMYTSYWTRTMDNYANAYFIDSHGQKLGKK